MTQEESSKAAKLRNDSSAAFAKAVELAQDSCDD